MSVLYTVPPTSSTESFNALFAPSHASKRSTRTHPGEVMSTLSSAVDTMESAARQEEAAAEEEGSLVHLDAEGNELDGMSLADLNISTDEFAGRLRPFHPPPVPVPFYERSKNVCRFGLPKKKKKKSCFFLVPLTKI